MASAARDAELTSVKLALARKYAPWFWSLDAPRADILAEIKIGMAPADQGDFERIIHHVEREDWSLAGAAILMSAWASRAGRRAWILAQAMKASPPKSLP